MTWRLWQRASYRIAAKAALILAVAAFLLGGGSLLLIRHKIARALDAHIAQTSDAIMTLVRAGDGPAARAGIAAAIDRKDDAIGIALFDGNGRRIGGDLRVPRPNIGWSDASFYDPVEGRDPARVLATDLPGGERLVIAGNRRPLQTADETIRWVMLLSALTIILLCVSLAVLLGRHLDRRLSPITCTADAAIAGNLSHRIPVSARGDEFDRVARSINTMLDRISVLMDNLRGIAGDIAHDLRTPLARLRARLEAGNLAGTTPGPEMIEDTIAAIDEILALFAAVLRIAEIEEGGAATARTNIDLSELASEIGEAMQPVFEDAGLRLHVRNGARAVIRADRGQLASAIINLLENVLRHATMGTVATLSVALERNHAILQVRDTGPGVPDADLQRIFDRFVRLDEARGTAGHGLGLSLVRAAVQANGGAVVAVNEPGGFTMKLRFPRSAPIDDRATS